MGNWGKGFQWPAATNRNLTEMCGAKPAFGIFCALCSVINNIPSFYSHVLKASLSY